MAPWKAQILFLMLFLNVPCIAEAGTIITTQSSEHISYGDGQGDSYAFRYNILDTSGQPISPFQLQEGLPFSGSPQVAQLDFDHQILSNSLTMEGGYAPFPLAGGFTDGFRFQQHISSDEATGLGWRLHAFVSISGNLAPGDVVYYNFVLSLQTSLGPGGPDSNYVYIDKGNTPATVVASGTITNAGEFLESANVDHFFGEVITAPDKFGVSGDCLSDVYQNAYIVRPSGMGDPTTSLIVSSNVELEPVLLDSSGNIISFAVPEPASIMLMLFGSIGCVLRAARRFSARNLGKVAKCARLRAAQTI